MVHEIESTSGKKAESKITAAKIPEAKNPEDQAELNSAVENAYERNKLKLQKLGINSPQELTAALGINKTNTTSETTNDDKTGSNEGNGESSDESAVERPASTKSATEMMSDLQSDPDDKYKKGVTGEQRKQYVLEQIERGNVPSFVRPSTMATVEVITKNGNRLEIPITQTRFCIGTDNDYMFPPSNQTDSEAYMRAMGYEMMTPKIYQAAHDQAKHKLYMTGLREKDSDEAYMDGNGFAYETAKLTRAQLGNKPPQGLTVGEGKVVFASEKEQKLHIGGGYNKGQYDGKPIQGLSSYPHHESHTDYSQAPHGVGKMFIEILPDGSRQQISYRDAMKKYPELKG